VTPPGAVATLPLDVTHPATFAGVPATLSRRALQTRLGRRHLFKLALPSHPRVFNATRESWQARVADHPWLCWTQPELQTAAHVLGAIALGPALKMVLERDAVLFLRGAVGSDAWRIMQQADPWHGPAPESVRRQGATALQAAGNDATAVTATVRRRGAVELVGHAGRDTALLGERMRLAYAMTLPSECAAQCWLPSEAVVSLIDAQNNRFAASNGGHENAEGVAG